MAAIASPFGATCNIIAGCRLFTRGCRNSRAAALLGPVGANPRSIFCLLALTLAGGACKEETRELQNTNYELQKTATELEAGKETGADEAESRTHGWHGQAQVAEGPERRHANVPAGDSADAELKPETPSNESRVPRNRARNLPALQPRLGEPITGLSPDELERFRAGRRAFGRILYAEDGLGPIHNLHSCVGCHSNPMGGSGTNTITMFGRMTDDGHYSELAELGGPLHQAEFTNPECVETIPEEANVITTRITSSVLGGGLSESVSDAALEALAAAQPEAVRGRVNWVKPLEDAAGGRRAGRFGFKSQMATLFSFSAKAARDELGLTNRLFPDENAPNGNLARATPCDGYPDPEVKPDASGLDFVDRITDFQRFLAPPPQTPRSGMKGEAVFQRIGCADCHVPLLQTEKATHVPTALRGREVRAYGDYLLHDMGEAADGIQQGDAKRGEMRTTPLWGFRVRFPAFHDGRVTGATVKERALGCIEWHRGQATASRERFAKLPKGEQDSLIRFLDSLGRSEFDSDGDNDVDVADWPAFLTAMSGPGKNDCSPEVSCAVVDVDQNGSVDLADVALLQRAFCGPQMASALVVP